MKPYRFHEGAESDLADALAYYRDESPALADRFHDEFEGLLRDVCMAPTRFRVIAAPVRRHFGGMFPYALLYVDRPDHVLVLAVSHFKRRPGYWRERLG